MTYKVGGLVENGDVNGFAYQLNQLYGVGYGSKGYGQQYSNGWVPVNYPSPWGTFMNTYAIAFNNINTLGANSFAVNITIPQPGTYNLTYSSDDNYIIQFNNVNLSGPANFTTSTTTPITFTLAGTYRLFVYYYNTVGPGGIAVRLTDPSSNIIWTTRDYLNTDLTVDPGDIVSDTNWLALTQQLGKIGNQTAVAINLALTPVPAFGNLVSVIANLAPAISTVTNNCLSANTQGTTSNLTVTRSTSWDTPTLTFTHTLTFANADAVRYFFNSGGQITMTATQPSSGGTGTPVVITAINLNGTVVPGSTGGCGPYSNVLVTGTTSGSVWGSNPYTDDSVWGKAAVHAGLITVGQTAWIARISTGVLPNFPGSTQNGITTTTWPTSWCGVYLQSATGPSPTPTSTSISTYGATIGNYTSFANLPAPPVAGVVGVFGYNILSFSPQTRYIQNYYKIDLTYATTLNYYVIMGGSTWGNIPESGENLVVQYSTNNSSWVTIDTVPLTVSQSSWTGRTINLNSYSGAKTNVYLRFAQYREGDTGVVTRDTWAVTPLQATLTAPVNTPASSAMNEIASDIGTVYLSSPTSSAATIKGVAYTGVTKRGGEVEGPTFMNTNNGYYNLGVTAKELGKVYSDDISSPWKNQSYIGFSANTNGPQGANGDVGTVVNIYTTFAQVPSGNVIAAGATATVGVIYPSTNFLSNTWGTVTITGSVPT